MRPQRASIATSIFSIIILLRCSTAQVSPPDTLRRGDSLNSSSQLVSPNSNFTLGFHTPQNSNNSYLAVLAVEFSILQSSGPLPVWIGNRENPIPPNSNPNLTIDASGRLIITYSGGSFKVYSGGSGNNFSATLLDTGNLVVRDSNEIVWQSFDFPTDVLLPGMRLGFNRRTHMNWILSSWFDASNPAPGAFTLEWDSTEGRLLIRRRGVIYWSSGRMMDYSFYNFGDGTISAKRFENIVPPDIGNWNYNLTNVTNDDEEYLLYTLMHDHRTPPDRRLLSNWRLDFNGDLNMLQTDMTLGIALSSNCYGYRTTATAGCQLWDQPTCRNDRQTFVLRAGLFSQVIRYSIDDNSSLGPSDCREICWDDCLCVGYNHPSTGCSYWRGRIVDFDQSLDGITNADRIYVLDVIKPSTKGMKKYVTIILCVLSALVLLVLTLTMFALRKLRQRKKKEELNELMTLDGYTTENGGKSNDLKLFTYTSIQSATHNFSSDNKLGQGGFGPVYKGKTPDGQEIAVKVLSRQSGQGLLEFKTELILVSKLQHVNLVKLIGFCVHNDDKMIIYDYMPNKSLDFFLFGSSGKQQLNWVKRFNIIEGIAQGLLYLHKYSRVKIIHRDLKTSNILLDQNMNPKISDFGLARIFKQDVYEANTNRRVGTYGYMAPEYAMQGIFSVKSDIYSFGVLILEIVTGQKNTSFHDIEGPLSLVEHAWELWRKDSTPELMDTTLMDSCVVDQLQRCVHIGLLCVENRAVDRPTIEEVISMLKSETTNMPIPTSPAFITRKGVMDVEKGKSVKVSVNEITLSKSGGR